METTDTALLELSKNDFDWFRRFIETEAGIYMPETKYIFLFNRITKRMKELGICEIPEYIQKLECGNDSGAEKNLFIDKILIPESSFFRYQVQFDFLRTEILPSLVNSRIRNGQRASILSMGSSRGQEIYSVAMSINEELMIDQRSYFRLSAVDISRNLLNEAREAYYTPLDIASLQTEYLERYFIKDNGGYRLLPRIARMVSFIPFNLISGNWNKFHSVDVIFCRNTMIYFRQARKAKVVRNIVDSIRDGGYLLLGHSEIIDGPEYGMAHLGNNIYRKERS